MTKQSNHHAVSQLGVMKKRWTETIENDYFILFYKILQGAYLLMYSDKS